MAFEWKEALPGVFHIRDGMGVCMTLLRGEKRALLVDTGYGAEDVAAFVRTLTDLPLTVVLTHGHHDHALGSRWFGEVHLLPEDFPVYETSTAPLCAFRADRHAVSHGLGAGGHCSGRPHRPDRSLPGAYAGLGGGVRAGKAAAAHRGQLEPLHLAVFPGGAQRPGIPAERDETAGIAL